MTGEKLRSMADSTLVLIAARLMAIVGVPISIAIVGYAATEFIGIKESMVEMRTALLVGIEPRLARVEQEQSDLRADIRARTQLRFDKQDADRMDAALRRDMARLEQEMVDIRRSLNASRAQQ